jgi:PAS domain-containing protein
MVEIKNNKSVRQWFLALVVAIAAAIPALVFINVYYSQEAIIDRTDKVNRAIAGLLDSTDYGYLIVDDDGVVIEFNPALERLTGYSRSEVIHGGLPRIFLEPLLDRSRDELLVARGPKQLGKIVDIIYLTVPGRDAGDKSLKLRASIRVVTGPYGRKYAIANVEPANLIDDPMVKSSNGKEVKNE